MAVIIVIIIGGGDSGGGGGGRRRHSECGGDGGGFVMQRILLRNARMQNDWRSSGLVCVCVKYMLLVDTNGCVVDW